MQLFKNTLFIDEVKNELPEMISINDTLRLIRTRKKYALIVGDKLHLTNDPYLLYVKNYFFTQLSKTTLIVL